MQSELKEATVDLYRKQKDVYKELEMKCWQDICIGNKRMCIKSLK